MLITLEQLEEIAPYSTDRLRMTYIRPLNESMQRNQITSSLRMSAFLAQILHESGSFHYIEEIASGAAYEHRADLGNLEPTALQAAHARDSTTGKFYKGRGLIQITGYYNYKECGEALHLDLINKPELLKEPKNAVESACWFWNVHNCNSFADISDFKKITKIINGGYNGLENREQHYRRCLAILGEFRNEISR